MQAEVNWDGSIAGMAEVLDEIPAGLELVYVEMYQKASYYNGKHSRRHRRLGNWKVPDGSRRDEMER